MASELPNVLKLNILIACIAFVHCVTVNYDTVNCNTTLNISFKQAAVFDKYVLSVCPYITEAPCPPLYFIIATLSLQAAAVFPATKLGILYVYNRIVACKKADSYWSHIYKGWSAGHYCPSILKEQNSILRQSDLHLCGTAFV